MNSERVTRACPPDTAAYFFFVFILLGLCVWHVVSKRKTTNECENNIGTGEDDYTHMSQ